MWSGTRKPQGSSAVTLWVWRLSQCSGRVWKFVCVQLNMSLKNAVTSVMKCSEGELIKSRWWINIDMALGLVVRRNWLNILENPIKATVKLNNGLGATRRTVTDSLRRLRFLFILCKCQPCRLIPRSKQPRMRISISSFIKHWQPLF